MANSRSGRLPTGLLQRLVLSNVLLVFALDAGKEWLLSRNIGVFWVLVRVLACAGFGVLVWEGASGRLSKKRTVEVRRSFVRFVIIIICFSCPLRSGPS